MHGAQYKGDCACGHLVRAPAAQSAQSRRLLAHTSSQHRHTAMHVCESQRQSAASGHRCTPHTARVAQCDTHVAPDRSRHGPTLALRHVHCDNAREGLQPRMHVRHASKAGRCVATWQETQSRMRPRPGPAECTGRARVRATWAHLRRERADGDGGLAPVPCGVLRRTRRPPRRVQRRLRPPGPAPVLQQSPQLRHLALHLRPQLLPLRHPLRHDHEINSTLVGNGLW